MYTLEITESAEQDLDQITDYIGVALSNPPAALAFLDEVARVSDGISDNPEMFPFCADRKLMELQYRKAVVNSYIMVYEFDVGAGIVRILRFFHSSENYSEKM